MKYGLKQTTLDALLQCLEKNDKIDEAVLYGSRAKGNFQPGSDIDLTLKGSGLVLKDIAILKMQLDDLLLPFIFDISVLEHIDNPDLLEHIQRIGICIYKR